MKTDPDFYTPDNPEEMQPDHDESLNPLVVPGTPASKVGPPVPAFDEPRLEEGSLLFRIRSLASTANGPDVKFPREIHQGMSGKDVIAHKRALSRARPDLYEWADFTPLAGDFFMDAVVKWKHSKGLGTTRVIGGRAHEVLEDTRRKGHTDEWAFDARAIELAHEYWESVQVSPDTKIRNAISSAGFFWYSHRAGISYSQYRPMQMKKPPFVPSRWDCSGFFTNCHYAGGAPNPNGRSWDGLGYTGTLMTRGSKVLSVKDLHPGDAIFYGRSVAKPGFNAGDPTHVAMYVGFRDGAHMILTLGSYPMKYVRYDYRHDINHFRHYSVA